MQITFIFIMTFLFIQFSQASECRAVQWPFSKEIKNVDVTSFQTVPRENLYKYLYRELSSAPRERINGLAAKLFFYLKSTEANEDKYQMVMALEWAAELQSPNPQIIPLSEICSMEDKINRQPSSTHKAKSTNPNPVKRKTK